MENGLERVSKAVGGGVRLLALIGGYVLLWVMGLTVAAVFMRKVFSKPIEGIQDLSEASLLVVVFFSLAYAGWTGAHIAVDIISAVLKGRASDWLNVAVRLTGGALLTVVSWQTIRQGLDALEYGDGFNMLPIPFYPFYFIVAFGSGLYALVLFLQSLRTLKGLPDIKGP